ncbi:hypothetical protein [Pendulispora albinea]|uniref:Uncharacterized protein n=1 Tax=Pendulispora albinea TaxID=2741071 RepID=A0ABZ2M8F0_9BACT
MSRIFFSPSSLTKLCARSAAAAALLGTIACGAQGGSDDGDPSTDTNLQALQSDSSEAVTPSKICTVLIGKAAPGEQSPILSKSCNTDTDATLLSATGKPPVLLMEWFEHANNNPPSLTRIVAADECDADGYRLRATGFWANRISGFNSYNECNVVTGYDLVNLSGDRQTWSDHKPCACVLVPWVGSFMNDRIESFWIRKG